MIAYRANPNVYEKQDDIQNNFQILIAVCTASMLYCKKVSECSGQSPA